MVRWPHGDPRDVIRRIVGDSRYALHPQSVTIQRSWLDDVHDWFVTVLRNVFHTLDHALGSRNPFGAFIGWLVICAAFGIISYSIYRLVRSLTPATRGRPGARSGPTPASVAPDAAALREAARTAARAGRYRDAAALLFGSAVRALDERGRVTYDPALTPGEYRRIVRDPLFDEFAGDAVIALFAASEPHDDLFARMSGTYDRFFNPPAR